MNVLNTFLKRALLLLSGQGLLLQARLRLHDAVPDRIRVSDIPETKPQCVQWKEHPEHIEENQVHPEVHEIAAIKILVAGEPLGSKSHEACVEHISVYYTRILRGLQTAI
jgi:hypothetical protein